MQEAKSQDFHPLKQLVDIVTCELKQIEERCKSLSDAQEEFKMGKERNEELMEELEKAGD